MATNPYVNKVVKSDGTTIIDISDSTVTAETLAEGITAYNAAGELITGSAAVSSWAELQQKVRNNDMDDISIGDQYGTLYQGKLLVFDVIGKDIDTPADPNLSHSLTLRVNRLLPNNLQFDGSEAIYYCLTGLSAGTYYFYMSGNHKFYLTQNIPIGGQIAYGSYPYASSNPKFQTYSDALSLTPIETSSDYVGADGTNLGTVADNTNNNNINSRNRAQYGSNDWKESAIRQWLNSNKPAGQWWEPQTIWDRPPTYIETMNGFLYDLDPEFLDVIGKTQVTTKYYNPLTAQIDGTYITEDYFFLLSQSQVNSNYSGEGAKYTVYSNDTSRVMYTKEGVSTSYFLRTPTTRGAQTISYISSSGTIPTTNAASANSTNYGIAPVCNII